MSTEQWIILGLSLATNAVVAIWALVSKLAPEWSKARLISTRDEREHRQRMDAEVQHYGILQKSWRDDKVAALLEDNESFIRERVWEMLEKLVAKQRQTEMTLAQTRDTLALLCQELAEMKEKIPGDKVN